LWNTIVNPGENKAMKVILIRDVEGLGERGAVVTVARGFARNFLFPRNLAKEATEKIFAAYQKEKHLEERRQEREKLTAEELASKLSGVVLSVTMKAGEGGRLFGSVTSMDVAKMLEERGIVVDRRDIRMEESIKTLGTHIVEINLPRGVSAQIQLEVRREGGEEEKPAEVPVEPAKPEEETGTSA
jgi:large subunit ribosomal protein L9